MMAQLHASGEPPLVGRDRERQRLRALLDEACAGHGSLVLVSGEAGIGKTTLVCDLIQQAGQQGALVLSGGCYDLTTTPPYGPWSEAIQGYQSGADQPHAPPRIDNADALQQVGSQMALFEKARRYFTDLAKRQPLVIILEDLHWADPASLEMLRYLARTLRDAAILLIATYRDDEITRRHELSQFLPLLIRESGARRIHLNRLNRLSVERLIADRYGLARADHLRLAEHVRQRSGGNPFFAWEIVRGLENEQVLQLGANGWVLGNLEWAHVPPLLRQVLELQLARRSDDTREALQVAALIGQEVPLNTWRTVSGLSEAALSRVISEALEARMLEEAPGGAGFHFRHALLREALHESVIMTRRRALHRQIGEFLTEGAMPDPDAIAYHFRQAGDPRASGWLIRAGVRAEGAYAWNSAARSYVAAHAMLESDPKTAQARGWLLFQVGYLLRYTDTGHAQAHLEEAERVASAIGDPVLAAHSRFFHGLLRCFRSELGEGVAEMGHAVGAADRISFQDQERARQAIASLFPEEIFTHPRVTSGGLLIKIGVLPDVNALTHTYILWLAIAGRLREAVTLGEDLVASVVAATDSELLIQDFCRDAYHGLALASETLGRPEDARRWWAQAIAAYGSIGHHALVGAVNRGLLVHVLTYRTERVTERRRVARAAVAAAERAGGAWGYPARTNALPLDLLEGRWDDARDVTLPVLDQANANAPPTAWTIRLPVFSVLGREWSEPRFIDVVWADIHAILRDGLATEPGDREYFLSTTAQRLAAELSLDAGDLHQARAWLEMHDRWLKWSGAVLGRTDAELLWARYHRIAGDLNVARRHAGRALNHASNPRQPLALIAAHRVLGTLDSDEGHHEDALDHLELSLELAGACAAPVEQAQTMLALSELATKSGDSDKAMSMLREVRRICEPLNTKRTLERAAQIERQLRSRVAQYPAGLSGREVEVLELVAEGMTNPEVGQTLFISPRTVSQHLRSIYNKLDVGSRTAAVARWAELSRE